MEPRVLLNSKEFEITVNRLCWQLIENHADFSSSVIIGIQPRGIYLSKRIHQIISNILKNKKILYGNLDVTFFRDDFRRNENPLIPSATQIDFIIENKKVILIDDVLYTGRTIRAAMDALLVFGRPAKVELLTLIDRRYSRDLPIEANYVGKAVDTIVSEKVKVEWQEEGAENKVWLVTKTS